MLTNTVKRSVGCSSTVPHHNYQHSSFTSRTVTSLNLTAHSSSVDLFHSSASFTDGGRFSPLHLLHLRWPLLTSPPPSLTCGRFLLLHLFHSTRSNGSSEHHPGRNV
ncbi:hypothetical protein P8452_41258 [Trifolium repens]|nr:hypothetical protein P8452_41258 [Trifolium repens]